jgi:hypothetical protein
MPDVELSPETLKFLEDAKKSVKKVEPVNSGLVTNPDEEDFNFWNKAGRLTLSAGQGVVNAAEEAGDFLEENVISLGGLEFGDKDGKFTFKDLIPKYVSPKKWKEGGYSQQRNLPVFHKPEGLAENMTEGASRFITGFIGPNKFFKFAGLSGGIVKTGLRGMSAGAVSDLTVFDPNEGRLSDMLVEFDSPVLNNAVTQYLATDEDDTEMEGRLKNVLEGMLIGGPFEILFGIKAFKKAKATKDFAEKEKIYKEAGEAINDLKKGNKSKKVLSQIVEGNKAINIKEYTKKILTTLDDDEIRFIAPFARTTKNLFDTIIDKESGLLSKDSVSFLSNQLKGAKPKYNYGNRNIELEFNNDIAKALYIVGGKGKSVSHEAYVLFLQNAGVEDIAKKSQAIRDSIKSQAKSGLDTAKVSAEIPKVSTESLKVSAEIPKKIKQSKKQTELLIKKINIGQKEAKKETESFIKKILNTKSFGNSAQVLKTIDDISERFDDVTKDYLENDVLKNQTAEELATLLSRDKGEILKALPKEGERAKSATVRMLATKQIVQELAFTLKETSEQYVKKFGKDINKWTKEAKEQVALQSEIVRMTVVALKDQIRGAARVTQAGRIKVVRSEGKVLDVEKLVDIIQSFRGDSVTMANLIKDAPLEEVINSVSKTKYQRAVEVFNSLYINSLLSGVFTQAINMKSGIYEALIRPIEQIGGGLVRGDGRSIKLGFAQYQGMMMSFGDTMKAVSLALRQGDAILDPLSRTQDNLEIIGSKAVRPISGANLGFDGSVGTAIDWVGNVLELPSRLLMTGDELLKQMNYRGRLFTNALDDTMTRGLDISSKEGKENIKRIFDEGFDKNGAANIKDNSINKKTLDYARESTYTNSLKGGSYLDWGSKVQTFLNNSPEFRFLAPFIRTPTNLWRHFGNRVPGFGLLTKQNRDLWSSGDRRARAEVLGRQMIGMSATMYGLHLATEDVEDKDGKRYPKITGNGPSNFNIKKTWLSMGWQPYSIAQINKDGSISYKQYNRMDPRFYILGIIADLKENLVNINDEQKEDVFSAAALTVFKNAANKTYLRGISDAMELIANPTENSFSKFFGGVVGNAIPYASLRNQGIPGILEPEKEVYETRGFLDRIFARTGLGEKFLEPRRDILTGEPIEKTPSSLYFNPDGVASFSFWLQAPSLVGKKTDVKNNPVAFEIARLRIPLGEPQKIKYKKVDLTEYKKNGQSAYDYMMQNIGKVKLSNKNLTEYLQNTFNSTSYKNLQEGNTEFDGGKEMYIRKIFKGFKDKAYYEMLKEYPEVKKAIMEVQKEKYGFLKRKKGNDLEIKNVLLP